MCGILGQISKSTIDQNAFTNNLLKLHHRGPDDHGTYFEDHLALGQTRLSILDLSHEGHQPMLSKCGNYILVYNGEVYNFEEIKKDLLDKNHTFHSHTDTEVILNGFIEYREKIVEKLNGMFAFAIYDKTAHSTFLARDRSGMKPLYYFQNQEEFVFSSELKTLTPFSKTINPNAKIMFLLLGYVPEPITIYDSIFAFPSGYYGYYQSSKLTLTPFDTYSFSPKIQKPYSEIVQDVQNLLYSAIKRHLISDAPLGTFLSGGVDSSLITAIAAKYKPNLQTVSLIFDDKDLNEEVYQDIIVEKYNTHHTKYLIDETFFQNTLNDFIDSLEQPTVDGLNSYFISKAAKEIGLTAVLSGVGGDELFYGYPSFKDGRTLKRLSILPSSIIKVFANSHKYKKLELLKAEKEFAYYLPKRGLFTPTDIAKILNIEVTAIYSLISTFWKHYNSSSIEAIEDKIGFFELNMYMKNQLLRDSDLFGMAHSLEIRIPFLDKELTDYALKIEPKEKFGPYNKQILADVAKNILPLEVIDRPKMGFTLPFDKWFRNNISQFNVDTSISEEFMDKKLHWSRFWALHVLNTIEKRAVA